MQQQVGVGVGPLAAQPDDAHRAVRRGGNGRCVVVLPRIGDVDGRAPPFQARGNGSVTGGPNRKDRQEGEQRGYRGR